jgi:hypothetical protein
VLLLATAEIMPSMIAATSRAISAARASSILDRATRHAETLAYMSRLLPRSNHSPDLRRLLRHCRGTAFVDFLRWRCLRAGAQAASCRSKLESLFPHFRQRSNASNLIF